MIETFTIMMNIVKGNHNDNSNANDNSFDNNDIIIISFINIVGIAMIMKRK